MQLNEKISTNANALKIFLTKDMVSLDRLAFWAPRELPLRSCPWGPAYQVLIINALLLTKLCRRRSDNRG
jgi:hypothetical protein